MDSMDVCLSCNRDYIIHNTVCDEPWSVVVGC